MKISNNPKRTLSNEQIDFMSIISDLQEQYNSIFWNTIDDEVFIYRALNRLEYKELLQSETTDIEKEDILCKACVLYPVDYDFEECPAGIPRQLAELILRNSFLDSLDSKKLIIAYHRNEMQEFDNQITCIISEAFPNIDIEEIERWDMAKTAKYLSRAEWKLNILRQIPIDYETSDRMMEADWIMQHSKGNEEMYTEQVQLSQSQAPQPQTEMREETLEERQARLEKEKGPRKYTPQEIAELKRRFPEIRWDAEVNPNLDITQMQDGIDTTAPALRTKR